MKKAIYLWLVLFVLLCGCGAWQKTNASSLTPVTPMEKDLMSATVVVYGLYVKNYGSAYTIRKYSVCTATAFERQGNKYHFITAAHCFVNNENADFWAVSLEKIRPIQKPDEKTLFTAKWLAIGDYYKGQDLGVIEADLPGVVLPVMPLALFDSGIGDSVSNVGAPLDEKKQLYRGVVKETHFSNLSTMLLKNAILLDLGRYSARPGSSGSAIVGEKQKGIVAILIGVGFLKRKNAIRLERVTIALPISQFEEFWKDFLRYRKP